MRTSEVHNWENMKMNFELTIKKHQYYFANISSMKCQIFRRLLLLLWLFIVVISVLIVIISSFLKIGSVIAEIYWSLFGGEPNRGYKELNLNPDILSLVFVSYYWIWIVQPNTDYWISRFVFKETEFLILTKLFVWSE